MSTHANTIIDLYRTHLDLVIPDNNLYDGNYETANFKGIELTKILEGVEFDEDTYYLTHQYLDEMEDKLYTLIFDESNTTMLNAVITNLEEGDHIKILSFSSES